MKFLVVLLCIFISCDIETEIVENSPDVNRELIIHHNNEAIDEVSLMNGATKQLTAVYKENGTSINKASKIDWKSENTELVTINSVGMINAIASGQTYITAQFNSTEAKVLVTIVKTDTSVAKVDVQLISTLMYSPGESVQLSAKIYNLSGSELSGKEIVWTSSNTDICTVSSSGLVSFLAEGSVEVRAFSESVGSMPLRFTIADMVHSKSGVFEGVSGHSVSGNVTVLQSGDDLVIMFEKNFSSQNGPNLFVTLASNKTSYSSSDKEVAALNGNLSGARTYTVPNVRIDTYSYIHIWCKPFNVVFGTAELK